MHWRTPSSSSYDSSWGRWTEVETAGLQDILRNPTTKMAKECYFCCCHFEILYSPFNKLCVKPKYIIKNDQWPKHYSIHNSIISLHQSSYLKSIHTSLSWHLHYILTLPCLKQIVSFIHSDYIVPSTAAGWTNHWWTNQTPFKYTGFFSIHCNFICQNEDVITYSWLKY